MLLPTMSRAQHAIASPARPDRFVYLVSGARDVAELIDAVREYLAAWPAEKVARLQTVDAGWAPFDENQRPTPPFHTADLREISDTVHGQCSALRGAGVALAPELLELDLFLFLACVKLSQFEAATCS
jgi:hypothetical protein